MLKILNMKYSRNGSGTCHPFITVLFEDKQSARSYDKGVCSNEFIATFQQESNDENIDIDHDSVRVNNVKHFTSNWDGSWFAQLLLPAIKDYCIRNKTNEISICAACFPDQYQKVETEISNTLNTI